MRTDILSFVMASENRKEIAKALLEYPKRHWSCSAIEELTKLPHSTVFRALKGFVHYGILKQAKINRKDILYEMIHSPLSEELKRALNIGKLTAKSIALGFVKAIKSNDVKSAVLYGSSVRGNLKPESDIDVLVVVGRQDKSLRKEILDAASEISSRVNKSISPVIMDQKELQREKNSHFILSVKENMEVLYGKSPF